MGMFDEVTIKCPECGNNVEEQSKAGPCLLRHYHIPGNAPLAVIADMQDDGKAGRLFCSKCNSRLEIDVQHIVTVRKKKDRDGYDDDY